MNINFQTGSAKSVALMIAAIVSLCLGVLFDILTFNAISFLLLLIFIGYCVWEMDANSQKAQQLADNVYFLGYLLTIIGIAGIAYKIALKPSIIESPEPILHRAAFALSSTIVGLIGMIAIRNMFGVVYDSVGTSRDNFQHFANQLSQETREFMKALRETREQGIAELNAQFRKIDLATPVRAFSESLVGNASTFADRIEEANNQLSILATNVTTLTTSTSAMNSSLPSLEQNLEKLLRSFTANKESLETLLRHGDGVQKLNGALNKAADLMNAIGTGVSKTGHEIKDLDREIRELHLAVEEFVTFTKNSLGAGLHEIPTKQFSPVRQARGIV